MRVCVCVCVGGGGGGWKGAEGPGWQSPPTFDIVLLVQLYVSIIFFSPRPTSISPV